MTEFGMLSGPVSPVQYANAPLPIEVRELERVKGPVKKLHPMNVPSAMEVTLDPNPNPIIVLLANW